MRGGSPDRCDFCGTWGTVFWMVAPIRKLCAACFADLFGQPHPAA